MVPPTQVLLNPQNITTVQSAILDAYKNGDQPNNPYKIFKSNKGKYFSIIHDGIQKFSKELLRVFIWTAATASKSIEIVNVRCCLNQVHGRSLHKYKLVEHLIDSTNMRIMKYFRRILMGHEIFFKIFYGPQNIFPCSIFLILFFS